MSNAVLSSPMLECHLSYICDFIPWSIACAGTKGNSPSLSQIPVLSSPAQHDLHFLWVVRFTHTRGTPLGQAEGREKNQWSGTFPFAGEKLSPPPPLSYQGLSAHAQIRLFPVSAPCAPYLSEPGDLRPEARKIPQTIQHQISKEQ
jgi:hypothetical protein